MEVSVKSLWILFLIALIINLTPAFATEISGIADEAKDYNEESKKKMGFFAKAKFMAKGYQLINKAEESSSQKEKLENKEEKLEDKYDALTNKTNNNTQNRIIGEIYRNRNTITINDSNNTKEEILAHIQRSLNDSANYIVNALATHNISLTLINHPDCDINLNNNIVQLVTDGGYIHYVLVKNIDLENSKVTYTKNDDIDSIMSLDEFKKSYTGIIIKIDSPNIIPLQVLTQIKKQHINDLDNIQNTAKDIKDKTKTEMIHNGIIIALCIVIMIIGCLLATWFSKTATTTLETESATTATESTATTATESTATTATQNVYKLRYRIGGKLYSLTNNAGRFHLNSGNDEILLTYLECKNFILKGELLSNAKIATTSALTVPSGVAGTSAAEGVVEAVATTSAQNYLATIVKIIGIFLIIGGLIGLIISTYLLIYNGMKWYETGKILKDGNKHSKKLMDWYTNNNPTKNTPLTNNTMNITNTTPTIQT